MPTHSISDSNNFHLRRPVLDAMSSLSGRWSVVNGGKEIEVDLPLSSYSPHERDVIEFAINPASLAKDIFSGLDRDVQKALAKALYDIFK